MRGALPGARVARGPLLALVEAFPSSERSRVTVAICLAKAILQLLVRGLAFTVMIGKLRSVTFELADSQRESFRRLRVCGELRVLRLVTAIDARFELLDPGAQPVACGDLLFVTLGGVGRRQPVLLHDVRQLLDGCS